MTYRLTTALVVIAFAMLAVFGLYLPGHIGQDMGCPFSPGDTAMCASSLSHLEHWQSAFTAVLVELLVLVGAAVVLLFRFELQIARHPQFGRFRLRQRVPLRPPLFQELYSQGILNRKEPQI